MAAVRPALRPQTWRETQATDRQPKPGLHWAASAAYRKICRTRGRPALGAVFPQNFYARPLVITV